MDLATPSAFHCQLIRSVARAQFSFVLLFNDTFLCCDYVTQFGIFRLYYKDHNLLRIVLGYLKYALTFNEVG